MPKAKVKPQASERERVLTEAVLAAAGELNLWDKDLAAVLGVSASKVSGLRKPGHYLEEGKTEFHFALAFVRIYRSLAGIVGTEPKHLAGWLHSDNQDLGGKPSELIREPQGLYLTLQYLDASRAVI